MKNLYNKIIDTFQHADTKKMYSEQELPAISYIDFDRGQFLDEEKYELLSLPALLINWTVDHRSATANLDVSVCVENLLDTSSLSLSREKALIFLDIVEITKDVLTNLESLSTGKLQLVSERTQENEIVALSILNFECSYFPQKTSKNKGFSNFERVNINENISIK